MNQELKAALSGIREGVTAFEPRLSAMQKQLDAIDIATKGGGQHREPQRSLGDVLKESDDLKRLVSDKRGKATIILKGADALHLSQKTTITETAVGSAVTGVLPIGRLPGITTEARQQLTIRDLLTATPTTFQVIDFVKVNSPMANASPVPEASTKPEQQATFTTVSERIKTIASWIPASRQVLDDMDGLVAFIQSSLLYYLASEVELQILSGDNVGEDLHGIIPQASAFNVGLLNAVQGWNRIDIIGHACQQITAAKELQPDFVILHPTDWWNIRLTKDGFGNYILGPPQQPGILSTSGYVLSPLQNLFGLSVLPTTNIGQGTFLVGSGSPVAAQILDRMEAVVELSDSHSTFFTQNLIAIRAECRLALVVRRPGSYCSGSFSTSP